MLFSFLIEIVFLFIVQLSKKLTLLLYEYYGELKRLNLWYADVKSADRGVGDDKKI